ncbi:MAG: hypothetical protein LBD45_00910 [Bacteroidales bacterium]|jgi:predicted  nucleic acid-binding Zn-ribbon protein|nr:hypothetical protein [Bacteroidales bacterium]
MKKIFIFLASALLIATSCKNPKESDEYKRLQAENDSLRQAGIKQSGEYSDMLNLINEVEDNLQAMKEKENYLTEQSRTNGELTPSTRERINSDMTLLSETLKKNKEQIAKLQNQLKSSNNKYSDLEKRLSRLSTEIDEKARAIEALQEELQQQKTVIVAQGQHIEEQSVAIERQHQTIAQQDQSLHTAYYVFGTKKELEQEKILVKGKVLQQGYNKDYFTRIDTRQMEQIPLYSKKARVLSTHPANSYTLEKNDNKELTFIILDKKEFWSIAKYLVIQVD